MYTVILILQYLAIAALLLITIYTLFQKSSTTQRLVVAMTLSALTAFIGYLLEIQATDMETAYMGIKIGYLGKPFALLTTFMFVLHLYGYTLPKSVRFGLLCLHAFITVMVFTNDFHHLYYTAIQYDASTRPGRFILDKGPVYALYMLMTMGYMVANTVLSIKEEKKAKTKSEKTQLLFVFGMIASGVSGYALFLTGLTGGYDSTMLGMFIGTLLLFVLFIKYRLFDLLTLVKDKSLYNASYGLLVINHLDETVYQNEMVKTLISEGLSIDSIFALEGEQATLREKDKVYSVKKAIVYDNGRYYGKTLEIMDITNAANYASRLETEVQDRTVEITHIQRTIISRLANIVDTRDNSAGRNTMQISDHVSLLCKGLIKAEKYVEELTPEYVTKITDVSPLHDYGKIALSDDLLQKPGKLTAEEYETVKTHTILGKKIIEDTMRGVETDEYVTMAEEVALYHHEHWDGGGYPYGRKGEAIPLSARIVAVADVYDSLLSKRSYRDAFSQKEALAIIKDGRGTQFDPYIVDALLQNTPTPQ